MDLAVSSSTWPKPEVNLRFAKTEPWLLKRPSTRVQLILGPGSVEVHGASSIAAPRPALSAMYVQLYAPHPLFKNNPITL